MLVTVLGLIRFGFSLIFGVTVSLLFAGFDLTKKYRRIAALLCIVFLLVQTVTWWFVGIDLTSKLYPVIIHLPLIMIFTLCLKRPWLISVISVLSGYLCCQAPRWVGFLAGAAFGSDLAEHIVYILAVIVFFFLLQKYVAGSVRDLMEKSMKSCMFLGGVPFFYYIFDYLTTIYTDVLYTGAEWAVQFMPSTVSVFYFVFVILYYAETQKQADIQRERDMLDMQLRQAKIEFISLRQIQQSAAAYRHDMRHHLPLLKGLASEGKLAEIQEYLRAAKADIDAITPHRFCENETVNLILASFVAKAKKAEIQITVDAQLPATLPLSDTELCSLLSNALENAILACKKIGDPNERQMKVRIYSKNNKLCIDIRNRYHIEPTFREGIPVSQEQGHGYGTKSMAHIVEKHGGICQFVVRNGYFIFQATT